VADGISIGLVRESSSADNTQACIDARAALTDVPIEFAQVSSGSGANSDAVSHFGDDVRQLNASAREADGGESASIRLLSKDLTELRYATAEESATDLETSSNTFVSDLEPFKRFCPNP
jgi:hypothetical protein